MLYHEWERTSRGSRISAATGAFLSILLLAFLVTSERCAAHGAWRRIDEGLYAAEFESPTPSDVGDGRITVIRANPDVFALTLVCAGAIDSVNRTVRQWCASQELVAAINAGMYAKDYTTHVGLCIDGDYVNNGRMRNDYKTILAFNPVDTNDTPVRFIDIECDDLSSIRPRYRTLVQNLRMISCRRRNVWSQQEKRYSIAALGLNQQGAVLFIFCKSPYSVHDFNHILLRLPLAIRGVMYLEGGAPTGMYLSHNGVEISRYGLPETTVRLDKNSEPFSVAYPLPNVIGLEKRK